MFLLFAIEVERDDQLVALDADGVRRAGVGGKESRMGEPGALEPHQVQARLAEPVHQQHSSLGEQHQLEREESDLCELLGRGKVTPEIA